MKGIFVGLLLLFLSQANAQIPKARTIKDPNTDFGKFRTYNWASQVQKVLDEDRFFLNDLILKADIRNIVRNALEERGYTLNRHNPDLIVNFRVLDKRTVLRGFEGYGRMYWEADEYNPATDSNSVDVESGTVIISLLDKEKGKVIWQGFASGLTDGNEFIKNEKKIREAINLLFEEYVIPAGEYTKR